jgi:hypothetical protein
VATRTRLALRWVVSTGPGHNSPGDVGKGGAVKRTGEKISLVGDLSPWYAAETPNERRAREPGYSAAGQ